MKWDRLLILALGIGLAWFLAGQPNIVGPPTPDVPPVVVVPVEKVTQVTFVYEKDLHLIPSPVSAALNTLNLQGIIANPFDQDTKDGTGDTPEQYKLALAAAKAAGLDKPVLVVQAGAKVVRILKDPKTETQVLEAAK